MPDDGGAGGCRLRLCGEVVLYEAVGLAPDHVLHGEATHTLDHNLKHVLH